VRTSQIDAAAPQRMVKAVAERTRLGEDAVDYVTMSFSGTGERSWYMSLDEGPARTRSWIAAADGSDLRKPGELSQVQKDADAKRKRQYEAEQRRFNRQLKRRSACLSKARDATSAARCIQRFPL
jgi:macrodomain Ter protein organizer (MatP/YcbG family)